MSDVTLKEHLEKLMDEREKRYRERETLMDERDRRYEERHKSSSQAVEAAFRAAEKATDKTESALKEYKVGSNEWRDTLKSLVDRMPMRPELEKQFEAIDARIADLREFRSGLLGRQTVIAVVVSAAIAIAVGFVVQKLMVLH